MLIIKFLLKVCLYFNIGKIVDGFEVKYYR